MTFVVFIILLFKDNKIIFAKGFALKNTFLYVLTTPVPLVIAVITPYYFRQLGDNLYVQRDVEDFNICKNCIKEDEPIEIIYKSGGPWNNTEFNFYYHCIGVAGRARDTFNILTTSEVYYTRADNIRYFSTTMMKIVENLHSKDSSANINDIKLRDIKKVVVNDDDVLDNRYLQYPTAIGELVTMIKTR
jgi:hypothetical protein